MNFAGMAFPYRRMRLGTLIAVLFTSLILLSVVTVAYLSTRGVRDTVDYLAYDLEARSIESLFQHLDSLLERPEAINSVSHGAAEAGLLDVENHDVAAEFFWKLGSTYPNIGTIAFADAEGNFVGANRPENYYVLARGKEGERSIRRYAPGAATPFGGRVLSERPGYDARKRSWYVEAVKAGKPSWTKVSLSVTTRRLDLTAVRPWISGGALKGVFLVDLSLGRINAFLKELELAKRGRIFLIDGDGFILACSDGLHFAEKGKKDELERVRATESSDAIISASAARILTEGGSYDAVAGTRTMRLDVEGEAQLVTVSPYRGPSGISWVAVLAIPERAVYGEIEANSMATVGFAAFAMILAAAVAVALSWWVTKPLSVLNDAAKELAAGHWTSLAGLGDGRGDEVGELTASFSEMSEKLRVSIERLRAEKETSARRAADLAESERKNTALLAAMPDFMFMARRDGTLIDARGHAGLFGEKALAAGMPDRNIAELADPPLCEELLGAMRAAMDTGRILIEEIKTGDAEAKRHYEARIIALGPDSALAICRDVTAEKCAEAERAELEARLTEAQKMEAIGTLAGGIAHDFNNLLQVVSGRLEMLAGHAAEKGDKESVEVIARSLDRAAGLVKGLLTFAHKGDRDVKPTDLNDEVRFVALMLERTLPKMIELRTNLAPELPAVNVDPVQIEQVMLNLAANARDAMGEGGVLTIATAVVTPGPDFYREHPNAEKGEYVSLSVSDTGEGIPEELKSRVFEPFFTTKEVGKGTGLGLSIVYGIAQENGGHISLRSEKGVGTTISIFFKASRERAARELVAARETTEYAAGGETVLLVDDEEEIRRMVGDGLAELGYKVLTAKNGEECLSVYAENKGRVDVIVLDLGMPGMGGRACLAKLRQTEAEIRVIVASGYGEQAIAGLASRATAFIAKPYRLGELIRMIKESGPAPHPERPG